MQNKATQENIKENLTMDKNIINQNKITATQTNDKAVEESGSNLKYIECEVENKRTEFEKHFLMSDGTFIAETYAAPIHYKDETGQFKDIDNSLVKETSDS